MNITADNASSNDTLVDELAKILPRFGGETNRTRCFLHIVNLVAKSLLREFDAPKKKDIGSSSSAAEDLMDEFAEDTMEEEEEEEEELQMHVDDSNENECDDDDDEGWVDEVELLSTREHAALTSSIRPIRVVLIKVRLE